MDLSKLGGMPYGIRLSGPQARYAISSTNANYGAPLGVTNLNISENLTQCCSVMVPEGKFIRLLNASLNNLGTTGDLNVEIEIDGVTVLESVNGSYTSQSATILGSGLSGVYSTAILDLIVNSNFKIRAKRSGAVSASLNVTYLVEG